MRRSVVRAMATGLSVDMACALLLRGMSLATTVVVARSLHEADYGAVSLALAVYGVTDMLTNPTLGVAVLRKPDVDSYTIDVAWTLTLLRAVGLGVLLFLSAPLLSRLWHGSEETATYLQLLSFAPLTSALSNMHAVRLQQAFRFGVSLLLDNFRLIATALISLVLLVVTRRAQALIEGVVLGNLAHATLTWIFVKPRPRPRLDLSAIRELTRVSRWLMVHSVLVYLAVTVDNLYVGKVLGLAALGSYALAWRVVNTVMTLFTRAVPKMMLPTYAAVATDPVALQRAVLGALYPSAVVGAMTAGLVLLCGPDLFVLMAGPGSFEGAATVAIALTPFVYTRVLNNVLAPLFQVAEPRTLAFTASLRLTLMLPAMFLGARLAAGPGVAAGISIVSLIVLAVFVQLLSRRFQIAIGSQLKAMLLPVAIVAPSVGAGMLSLAIGEHPALRLLVGAVVLATLSLLSWELTARYVAGVPSLLGPLLRLLKSPPRPQAQTTD